jgi:hypothetical protein
MRLTRLKVVVDLEWQRFQPHDPQENLGLLRTEPHVVVSPV